MSKKAKQLVADEYQRMYEGVDSVCVVDLTGLDAKMTHRVRGRFREKGIELHVVRNALARRAFEGSPLEPVGKALSGPCALVKGGHSIIDVARELVSIAGETGHVALKFGVVEGAPELIPIEQMARMKSRAELQGEVVMLILSPWRRVCGQVTSPWARVAGCIKAIGEKHEESQAA